MRRCGGAGLARETLEAALVQAYLNNPSLNSQRAAVRATDENVPQALAGYRPSVSANVTGGEQTSSTTTKTPRRRPAARYYSTLAGYNSPVQVGITATQTLFNGFQTANRTRQAESQVLAARETLRNSEQTVLLNAATAYMNLLRDTAILDLQRRNVEVLAGATAPDARPLQCRRGDPHRRRAVGIAARRRPLAGAHRAKPITNPRPPPIAR